VQCSIVQLTQASTGQYDGVDAAGGVDQSMLLVSKSFPRHSLDAIALVGLPYVFFGYYDTEAGVIELVGACENQ